MAILVQKKQQVDSQFKMVKLQILLYTFFKNIDLTSSYLDCASLLAIHGFDKNFFKTTVTSGVFKSEQSARNCMSKLKAAEIIVKDGKFWKLNPEIAVGVDQVILLDLKAGNL